MECKLHKYGSIVDVNRTRDDFPIFKTTINGLRAHKFRDVCMKFCEKALCKLYFQIFTFWQHVL